MRAKVYILLLIACFGYAFGPPAYMKLAETGLSKDLIVGYFLLIGGIGLIPVYSLASNTSNGSNVRLPKVLMFASGILWSVYFLGYIYAMEVSSITETTLGVRMTPLVVVLLSAWLLNEKVISWVGVTAALVLCLAGVVAMRPGVVTSTTMISPAMLAILGVCSAGACNEVLRTYIMVRSSMTSARVISASMILGGIAALAFSATVGHPIVIPNMEQFLYLLLLGLGTVAIPAHLNLIAYNMIGSQSKVTFFAYLIPIITAIIAYAWNHERADYVSFAIGFVCITTGIMVVNRSIVAHAK